MKVTRQMVAVVLLGAGAGVLGAPLIARLFAQSSNSRPPASSPADSAIPDHARRASAQGQETPNRREFTVVARDFQFSPKRLEVSQDDVVKLTVRSEDVAYSLTIDEYRVAKRVPAGGTTTFEF